MHYTIGALGALRSLRSQNVLGAQGAHGCKQVLVNVKNSLHMLNVPISALGHIKSMRDTILHNFYYELYSIVYFYREVPVSVPVPYTTGEVLYPIFRKQGSEKPPKPTPCRRSSDPNLITEHPIANLSPGHSHFRDPSHPPDRVGISLPLLQSGYHHPAAVTRGVE